jgi:glycosyltransferase involved in cell wall biosynthesis
VHIAVDGRELCGRATGVGRYLARLLGEWARLPAASEHAFTIYVPPHCSFVPVAPTNQIVRQIAGGSGTIWEQFHLRRALAQDHADVLFAPGYTAPLFTRVPTVVTIHDLSFAAHPEWFSWREGLRRRWLTRQSAHRARTVLTDTEFSRREIVERLGISPDTVHVIPLGIDVTATAQRDRDPLVLFVGSVLNRRHVPELIAAFKDVVRDAPAARLAIVGENRTHPREDLPALVDRLGLRDRVVLHDFVDDAELSGLYRRARVFVFLSEYEGFGLTPLEALAAGVPIVVLDTAGAREVYGNAAHYVRLDTPDEVSAAISTFLTDEGARRDMLDRAGPVLARYSWPRAAVDTLKALTPRRGWGPALKK